MTALAVLVAGWLLVVVPVDALADAVEVGSVDIPSTSPYPGNIYGNYPHPPYLTGTTLYVPLGTFGEALGVVDLSDPAAPSLTLIPDVEARDIVVAGDLAYTVDANELHIYDLGTPGTANELGSLDFNTGSGGAATYLALGPDPDRVYVAGGGPRSHFPTLRAVDVSNPADPIELWQSEETRGAGLAIVGSTAFVASYSAGLRIYDLSEPGPHLIGATGTLGTAIDIVVHQDIAYVLNLSDPKDLDRRNLATIDVADPTRPRILGIAQIPPEIEAGEPYLSLRLLGDFVYAGSSAGLLAFDVSDPRAPFALEVLGPELFTVGVEVLEDLVITTHENGVSVLRPSPAAALPPTCGTERADPACLYAGESFRLPLPFASYHPFSSFTANPGPILLSDLLHVPLGSAGLVHLGIVGENELEILSHLAEVGVTEVVRAGDTLHAVHGNRLLEVDFADPTQPVLVAETTLNPIPSSVARSLAVRDGIAFVSGSPALQSLDLDTDPPTSLGASETHFGAHVLVEGDLAYVAAQQRGLLIFDISDPQQPIDVGSAGTFGTATRLALDLPWVYVLNTQGDHFFSILDASDPTAPRLASLFAPPSGLYPPEDSIGWFDMKLGGDRLLVTTARGAYAIDVTDPEAPRGEGLVGPREWARGMAVAGDDLFVAHDLGVSVAPLAGIGLCDADASGVVDAPDIVRIIAAEGVRAERPFDPRDGDLDGRITSLDAEICLRSCPDAFCPPAQPGRCEAPGEVGHLKLPWFRRSRGLSGNSGYYPVAQGTTVFVPSGSGGPGVSVFDVSDPALPSLLATIPTVRARSVALDDDLLVAVDGTRVHLVDVSAPEQPRVVSELELPGTGGNLATAVAASGGLAYVTGGGPFLGNAPAVQVVDYFDPDRPVLRDASAEIGGADIALSGDLTFTAAFSQGLLIHDVSRRLVITSVGGLELGGSARQVEVAGSLAVLVVHYEIVLVDVSDPSAPIERSRVAIPSEFFDDGDSSYPGLLSLSDGVAYLAGARGAVAVDLSDPDQPIVLGLVGDGTWSGGVARLGDHLVHVSREGIQVLAKEPIPVGEPSCAGCPSQPLEQCLAPAEGSSKLRWKTGRTGRLQWRWKESPLSPGGHLRSPLAGTTHDFCVYDATPKGHQLVIGAHIPSGDGWKEQRRGFRYRTRSGLPDGVRKLSLKRSRRGPRKISLEARRLALPLSPLAQSGEVVAQLSASDGGCWEARYAAPAKHNTEGRFHDRHE